MTNDLRALIQTRLNSLKATFGLKEVSYKVASEDAMYPHIVYDFSGISPMDMGREDYTLDINIWGKDPDVCFEIMDGVRELFSFRNDPQATILPTFYEISGDVLDDPDKTLVHLVIRFETQVYDRSDD